MPHGRRAATFAMALMARAPVEGGQVHLAAVFAQLCEVSAGTVSAHARFGGEHDRIRPFHSGDQRG